MSICAKRVGAGQQKSKTKVDARECMRAWERLKISVDKKGIKCRREERIHPEIVCNNAAWRQSLL
jgi:hypothetical protein